MCVRARVCVCMSAYLFVCMREDTVACVFMHTYICARTQVQDGVVIKEGYSPTCVRSVLEWPEPRFTSAFPLGQEARERGWFSTWKSRAGTEVKHMIDYIFATR